MGDIHYLVLDLFFGCDSLPTKQFVARPRPTLSNPVANGDNDITPQQFYDSFITPSVSSRQMLVIAHSIKPGRKTRPTPFLYHAGGMST
jgi:hypothetical protein